MKYFIIDGNNLIGKMKDLWNIQKVNPQSSREKLAYKIERFFAGKPQKASLHFDGHPAGAIKITYAKIVYSFDKTADDSIKLEISNLKNPKLATIVTSDNNLTQFARKCSCNVITSEEFARSMKGKKDKDEESSIIKNIKNDEIKRLFGVD
ncbi:MAG: NYN domain-containing protein [Melioribacteraceae bacterium]|nr:NYN domain-containing protein [Melioribacteraceae bacterium]